MADHHLEDVEAIETSIGTFTSTSNPRCWTLTSEQYGQLGLQYRQEPPRPGRNWGITHQVVINGHPEPVTRWDFTPAGCVESLKFHVRTAEALSYDWEHALAEELAKRLNALLQVSEDTRSFVDKLIDRRIEAPASFDTEEHPIPIVEVGTAGHFLAGMLGLLNGLLIVQSEDPANCKLRIVACYDGQGLLERFEVRS